MAVQLIIIVVIIIIIIIIIIINLFRIKHHTIDYM